MGFSKVISNNAIIRVLQIPDVNAWITHVNPETRNGLEIVKLLYLL
jgi:hypothetical protein